MGGNLFCRYESIVMTRRKQYDEQKAYLASLALEIVEPDEAQVNEEEVLTRLLGNETGRTPPTSAPGLGAPLPHLHRDWARPLPHLHRDPTPSPGLNGWARRGRHRAVLVRLKRAEAQVRIEYQGGFRGLGFRVGRQENADSIQSKVSVSMARLQKVQEQIKLKVCRRTCNAQRAPCNVQRAP